MNEILIKIYLILIAIGVIIAINSVSYITKKDKEKEEYIKQLEQSLQEQIQEVEVYRGILEEYQTEGIINEQSNLAH